MSPKAYATFTFTRPPHGALFASLMQAALSSASMLTLVERPASPLSLDGQTFLESLRAYSLGTEEASAWPGTQLLAGSAKLHRFRLTPEVVQRILGASDGVADWLQPNLPEDLALVREDGSPWLGTITHEGDAFLMLTDDEQADLETRFPSVWDALKRDQGRS
jgi:hypothetical protein